MNERTLLSIDYGMQHVGVAIKEAGTTTALPLHTFECTHRDRDRLIDHIRDVCREYQCDGIVIGLPLSMDGKENEMTMKTSLIGHEIKRALDIPVYYEDERLTSKAAGDHDKAAALILQSFIDRRHA